MKVNIENSWYDLLKDEFQKEYFIELSKRVRDSFLSQKVFPPPKFIFRAFDLVPVHTLKVLILGQDPYHTPKVADGLAFSSLPDNPIPPSLKNIFKEIEDDLKIKTMNNPDLSRWAVQGVMLLNTVLTVLAHKPASHKNIGWEIFTDNVIKTISKNLKNVVFMLWGKFASEKSSLIDTSKHLVLVASHPSPFSADRGFFGCKHFSKANEYLASHGKGIIDWR